MRRLALLGLFALVACDGGPSSTPVTTHPPGSYEPNAVMLYVSDGDTINVSIDGNEERVRLIGIDTPETKKPDTPVECFGPEATAFTESLLPEGTPLYLERDIEGRDQYGRLLAYVYRSGDGLFVNMAIVTGGYARPLTFPPNIAHADEFVIAARTAEANDVGLWAGCSG